MDINWVNDLIENIPNIISYIVYGYVYLSVFYWISFKDNDDFENLLIKSVAVSYLLTNIFDLIVNKYNIMFVDDYDKVIKYFIASAILGFLVGKIISHRWFNHILYKLNIERTMNKNIWDDVIKPFTWVRVFMEDGSSYQGQVKYIEPFKSEPIIALITWQKLDVDVDIVIDNSQNPNELILLNTKDFVKIEITYQNVNRKSWYKRIWEIIFGE